MNIEAANDFADWFRKNGARLAVTHAEMLSLPSNASSSQKMMGLFAKLEEEVFPRLSEIQDGLIFEVGPGKTKKHGFILSAGGIRELIPAVRYLTDLLKDSVEWEVIAFKPAREVSDSTKQLIMTSSGEKVVQPSEIYVSLHPELTKVGVHIYFNHYDEEDYQAWGQVGFNFLDFSLGEYAVMESVGDLGFHARSEAPTGSFPLAELQTRFAEAITFVRSRYTELSQISASSRVEQTLNLLSTEIENLIERLKDESSEDEVQLNLIFWAEDTELKAILAKHFEGFEISSAPKLSAAGEGLEIIASGTVQRNGFDLQSWLKEKLSSIKEFLLLVGVQEAEPINPFMAQFAAASLIEGGSFDEAIKILKSALRGAGDQDAGQIHCLLAHAYLKAERYQEALEVCDEGFEYTEDPQMQGELLTNKGNALQKIDRFEDALTCFEKALALDEENPIRLYNLGQAYALKGLVREACQHLANAIRFNPDLKELMLSDPDLEKLRGTQEFKTLL